MLKLLNRGTTDLEVERVGKEVAPTAWARLTLRQDSEQREIVETGLIMLPCPELSRLQRYVRLFLMCRAYLDWSDRRGCVHPMLLRTHADHREFVVRVHPNHLADVQGAIVLAKARGCGDDGHALAHIALSFLACGGWGIRVPSEGSAWLSRAWEKAYAHLHISAAAAGDRQSGGSAE